jgi:hypothetical protein
MVQEVLLGKSIRGFWTPEDQKENQLAQPEPLKKGKEMLWRMQELPSQC